MNASTYNLVIIITYKFYVKKSTVCPITNLYAIAKMCGISATWTGAIFFYIYSKSLKQRVGWLYGM